MYPVCFRAHSTTERLERDTHLGKIIQRVRNKYGHSLKLATYLQLPVLRITKYHLLLQRYLKLLDSDSLAYQPVSQALELMRQVNDQINRDMPESSDESVHAWPPARQSCPGLTTLNLTGLFGAVLKQGDLALTDCPNSSHHIVVFQTMFLIRQSHSNSKIINTITVRGHFGISALAAISCCALLCLERLPGLFACDRQLGRQELEEVLQRHRLQPEQERQHLPVHIQSAPSSPTRPLPPLPSNRLFSAF